MWVHLQDMLASVLNTIISIQAESETLKSQTFKLMNAEMVDTKKPRL
jgi:hypothetical protein